MCPIFSGCVDTAVRMLRIKGLTKGMNERQMTLIAFIGYVNDISKWEQFKLSVQKSHHRFQYSFQLSWQ
jgi:hypothetical protein